MTPDLRSPIGGAPIHQTSETASTMDDARGLVRRGTPSGTVVVTDYQSAGRGRRAGRVWHSSPGESLMFTLALERPEDPVTRSLVMAASVSLMLEERFGLEPSVKWPNDVLVAGRKVCGILADHENGWLYLGVGLNVRQTEFPGELASLATSVRLATSARPAASERPAAPTQPRATPLSRRPAAWDDASWPALRDELLIDLLERYRGLGDRWHEVLTARLWLRGEPVDVAVPGGATIHGRVDGIGLDGRLIVSGDGVHRLAAGEVSLSRKASDD